MTDAAHQQEVDEPKGSSGEDSGLADIRAVAAAMHKAPEESHEIILPPEEDDDDPLASAGFGANAAASLVASTLEPAPALAPVAESTAPAANKALPLLAIAAGGLAAVGVVLALALSSSDDAPAQATAPAIAAATPTPADSPGSRELTAPVEDDDEQADQQVVEDDEPTPDADQADASADAEPDEESAVKRPKTPDKKTRPDAAKSTATESGAKPKAEPKPKPEPEPEPTPAKALTADCLLNPDNPECALAKKKANKVEKDDADASLPEKLTPVEIRNTLKSAKVEAKACGAKYLAAAGTKVRVKISISGKTGEVSSATPIGDHATGPLGKCVADALAKTTFGRFKKSVMGVTYPVTL